jgi:hypothetical protein
MTKKRPVSLRTLKQRINRKLQTIETTPPRWRYGTHGLEHAQLVRTRGEKARREFGDWHVMNNDTILFWYVDPVGLGRDIGVLGEREDVEMASPASSRP